MAETVGLILLSSLTVETAAGTAAVGALTIAGTSVSVASVVGAAVLAGGSIALAAALTPAPEVPKTNLGTQALKQAVAPRPFGYGRCRLAGNYALFGEDGSTSYDVIAFHHGLIVGIVDYFLNEDIVYLSGSGDVVNSVPDAGQYLESAVAKVKIKSRVGVTPETAYTEVAAALPERWTSAHRGDGVASLELVCAKTSTVSAFTTTYPRGLPKPSVLADLSRVFDPRDGAQSRGDPTTWTLSTNPVLILLDYLTHAERGPALDWNTFVQPNLTALMAEATVCDEIMSLADGGTEKRYRCAGWAYLTTEPAEVIGAILATCDGWLCEKGDGTLALRVGKYAAPTITLTDDHIIGFTIDKGVADEEIVNEMRWTFTPPGNDYREAAGDPWQDSGSIAEIGKIRTTNVALPWVQSHTQGRRLLKRRMAREQATARGTLRVSLFGIKALGERFLKVQSNTVADLTNAVIEVVSKLRVDLASASVTFDWVLVNTNSIDAWSTTEEGNPPLFDSRLTPTLTGLVVANSSSKIQATFNKPGAFSSRTDLTYALEWRLSSTGPFGAFTREVFASATDLGATLRVTTTNTVASGTYDVRIASKGAHADGAIALWSNIQTVVIP